MQSNFLTNNPEIGDKTFHRISTDHFGTLKTQFNQKGNLSKVVKLTNKIFLQGLNMKYIPLNLSSIISTLRNFAKNSSNI